MSGKPDLGNVGADRGIQDPADALQGTYADPVDKIPMPQRTQESTMPQAPDPNPLSNVKKR